MRKKTSTFPKTVLKTNLLLIVFSFIIILSAFSFINLNKFKNITGQVAGIEIAAAREKEYMLNNNYHQQINLILHQFQKDQKVLFQAPIYSATVEQNLFIIKKTEEKILSLSVPADQKNNHLKLIILFDNLKQQLDDQSTAKNLIFAQINQYIQ